MRKAGAPQSPASNDDYNNNNNKNEMLNNTKQEKQFLDQCIVAEIDVRHHAQVK